MHEAVGAEGDLAYTTVATMLRKMEARGLLRHRLEDRNFVYREAVAEEAVTRGMADMVRHLLCNREVSRAELSKLEKLIAERKRGR